MAAHQGSDPLTVNLLNLDVSQQQGFQPRLTASSSPLPNNLSKIQKLQNARSDLIECRQAALLLGSPRVAIGSAMRSGRLSRHRDWQITLPTRNFIEGCYFKLLCSAMFIPSLVHAPLPTA